MDPLAVADGALDAVATDRFLVFTHPEQEDAIRRRIRRRIDEAFDERDTTVPPMRNTATTTTIGAR